MSLEKIISITGKPGLFKLVTQSKGGFIIEDVRSGKKTSISSQNQVSLLENIAIYTETEEIPLKEVFHKIFTHTEGGESISHKSSEKELRAYMETIMPDYDKDRVYASDLKKLFNWYNTLTKGGVLTEESFKAKESENEGEE